ncbi:MAG: hypothetical protein AABO58_13085 [Acidobacteriota bacterium]
MSDNDESKRDRDEELREKNLHRTLSFVFAALGIGFLAVIVYASSSKQGSAVNLNIAATGVIVAGAFALLGFAGGFLFGIPKSLQGDAAPAVPAAGAAAEKGTKRSRLTTNTNLEQMSDWLTKILVGVGLTQLVNVGDALWKLAEQFKSFFGGNVSEVFIIGIVLYFSTAGFLAGYFWTRLFLAGAFSLADRSLEAVSRAMDELRGDIESTRQVAETALDKSQPEATAPSAAAQRPDPDSRLEALAKRYNEIRDAMSKGSARTAEMTRIVNEMIDIAPSAKVDVRKWLFSDDRGQRLAAYARLYKAPDPTLADALVQSVTSKEDKNFGEYWGIRAIGKNSEHLSEASVNSLRARLQQLKPTTDRYAELRRVLADIDARRTARA